MSNDQDKMPDPSLADSAGESDAPVETGDDGESGTSYQVAPAPFPSLTPSNGPADAVRDIEFLADVNLEVVAELGRAQMSLRELLGLAPGVVIELDKVAGEPVAILVNGKIVGRGEVVTIEDMFGVRVTEIIPPSQRWKYE